MRAKGAEWDQELHGGCVGTLTYMGLTGFDGSGK